MTNFFILLELEADFNIDRDLLEINFVKMVNKYHPDLCGINDPKSNQQSAHKMTLINLAYSTLKNDELRLRHLFALQEIKIDDESMNTQDFAFLEEIMEKREAIDELFASIDTYNELNHIEVINKAQANIKDASASAHKLANEHMHECWIALKEGDYGKALDIMGKIRYLINLKSEIDERIAGRWGARWR